MPPVTPRFIELATQRGMHLYWRFARGLTVGVRALVIDGTGRVFLVKHSYVAGWHLPGGGVEAGESLMTALTRELREEGNIEVTAVLRAPSGESLTEKIPVEIPLSAGYQSLTLFVGGGSTINALEGRFTPLTAPPRDLQQAVRALNRMRRDNRLYALLMVPQNSFRLQGDEFPSPPPSLLQTFLSDPAAASRVTFSGTSVVGDFETSPTPYSIQGQQMLSLKVIH